MRSNDVREICLSVTMFFGKMESVVMHSIGALMR